MPSALPAALQLLTPSCSEAFTTPLDAEGLSLLELAGVKEDSFMLAPSSLPTPEKSVLSGDSIYSSSTQSPRTARQSIASQISLLLDEPATVAKGASPPLVEASCERQNSCSQLRQSIASQLSSVLHDEGWDDENDSAYVTSALADSLAAMGMSPPRCAVQRKASTSPFVSAAPFTSAIHQRPGC